MGQLFSLNSEPKYDWDISVPLYWAQLDKFSGHYASQPQRIRIAGPTRLSCTLEVDQAVIDIKSSGHHVVVSGSNNTIRVWGDGLRIRIEGDNNTLIGTGTGTFLYTNDVVDKTGIVLARRDARDADGAPERLDLRPAPVKGNAAAGGGTKEDLKLIRLAYKDRQDDGDDDHSNDAGNENVEEEDEATDSLGSGFYLSGNGKWVKQGAEAEELDDPADSEIK